MELFLDTETRGPNFKHGTAKYAITCEVIINTWAVDDGPVRRIDHTAHSPRRLAELQDAARRADVIWAHDAYFDRSVLATCDWWRDLQIPLSKWRCSKVLGYSHGLLGGLARLCQIFGVSEHEAKLDGTNYIKLFSTPKKDGSFNDRHSHPKEWEEFLEYAERDIPSMRRIIRLCPKWNYSAAMLPEVSNWHLDQRINDRGFAVDVEFADAAVRATTAEKKRLGDRVSELTEGTVDRATQRDMLLGYLQWEYGIKLPDLAADTLERLLDEPDLPDTVKELIRIRLQASKSSTSKYKVVQQRHVGGRLYGTLQFAGASRTGRWGGRGFQPQNMQRPTHKFPEIEAGIEAFKAGCEELITDNIMALATSAIRSTIIAAPGKKLVVSDLSNIEGRVLAWMAGEEWKLQAFRDFDAGLGPDLYKVAYGRSFGVAPESVEDDSPERQIGKVQELALGYQGGVGAFVTMASTYRVDLEEMAVRSRPVIPKHVWSEAEGVWKWADKQRRTLGLNKDVYVCAESLKSLWRVAHPETANLWSALEYAAKNAVQNPGVPFDAGPFKFDRPRRTDGKPSAWLRMRLPSGRYLCYANPKVDNDVLSYMGSYMGRWIRTTTYGGKLAENGDQAISRDVFVDGLLRAEAEGYAAVLLVHDELDAEVPDDPRYTAKRLSQLLATNSPWNVGLPLAAKGFETYRYKKS